jgi:spermidine synthase
MVMESLLSFGSQVALAALFSAIILFSIPSFLLGIVSPYAVKLKIKNLNSSGQTVGNLYALSTAGSIVGTFLAGFLIIPLLGVTKIIFLLSAILVLLSLFLLADKFFYRLFILFFLVSSIFAVSWLEQRQYVQTGKISFSTPYNEVLIFKGKDQSTDRPTLNLSTDRFGRQSTMFLDGNDLSSEYSRFYRLMEHFNPGFKETLMIGGAAYIYPQYYLRQYPEAKMDVVEIDPKLTELARKYFSLQDDPRLNIIHEDGRVFLNQNKKKYDVVLMDAFNSISIPPQLASKEAVEAVYNSLDDEGIVLVNIISAVSGRRSLFLQAEYTAYKAVFPQVMVFVVNEPGKTEIAQNLMLVALKSDQKPKLSNTNSELNLLLQRFYPGEIKSIERMITDDYAPVDHYMSQVLL